MIEIEKIIDVLESPKTWEDINRNNMVLFRSVIVPDIYEEQRMFPKGKKTNVWRAFREYSVPPNKWLLGVWTGATYTALVNGSTADRKVLVNSTKDTNTITIVNSEYLNATLYLSKKNNELLVNYTKKQLMEKLK